MDETKEQQSLHKFFQFAIYLFLFFDIYLFVYAGKVINLPFFERYALSELTIRISRMIFFEVPHYSKMFMVLLICLVSVGTLSKKKKDLDLKKAVLIPLPIGIGLLFGSLWFLGRKSTQAVPLTDWTELAYIFCSVAGTLLFHISMDNISKFFHSNLGKDKWNVEGESFMQPVSPKKTKYAINIPMLFYFGKKVRKGYIILENVFRGTLLIGTPGSGKSFGVIMPVIRQMIAKEFTMLVYDFKFPDLGKIAYYHYLLAKQHKKCKNFRFHVINLTEPEKSRRINPWKSDYIRTLADASETAEAMVEAMKKGDKAGGSDQFFTQSAVNFLASCIYFFSKYDHGRYSSLPHVLAFLNRSYDEIFSVLFTNKELTSLLSPFMSAYRSKAFDQLEGQLGTLKIFISRLATKETFWVFSGEDFDLKISNPEEPSILVLANDPDTQNINSACYSVVLNRITRLINSKGNLPSALIIDEAPTLYAHRVENLIASARSNLVAVLLGLQELPQFKQQYGKETATTIFSIIGNVLSGAVRNKETLDWLERILGKVKQENESLSIDRNKTSVSLSERLEPLIPAGKIASLKAGEMVGILSADAVEKFTGKFETSAVNCRININPHEIKKEESAYRQLPLFYQFNGKREEILYENFMAINKDIEKIVKLFRPSASQASETPPKNS